MVKLIAYTYFKEIALPLFISCFCLDGITEDGKAYDDYHLSFTVLFFIVCFKFRKNK